MENDKESKPSSQGFKFIPVPERGPEPAPAITVQTGRILYAALIVAGAAVATIALGFGSYKLGFYVALAGSYERQITKLEAQSAGLMALVGVVDQAKGREFMSCVESGRSDCMSIIAPVVP